MRISSIYWKVSEISAISFSSIITSSLWGACITCGFFCRGLCSSFSCCGSCLSFCSCIKLNLSDSSISIVSWLAVDSCVLYRIFKLLSLSAHDCWITIWKTSLQRLEFVAFDEISSGIHASNVIFCDDWGYDLKNIVVAYLLILYLLSPLFGLVDQPSFSFSGLY